MTEPARALPARLAAVVEELELEQPRVVTIADLQRLTQAAGLPMSGRDLGYQLHRLGWLLSLRTRGAWEFAPAARAGRYDAGDRYIELRATLAVNPGFPGVIAMESAALLLGFAGHVPDAEVLALPLESRAPKAFDQWRVVRVDLPVDVVSVDGLPTWRVEALLAGMAIRPDGFHDWPNVPQWLPRAVAAADANTASALLASARRAAWLRLAYLFAFGHRVDVGQSLRAEAPPGRGPAHLGPRDRPGRYDRRFDVVDSVLAPGLDALQS